MDTAAIARRLEDDHGWMTRYEAFVQLREAGPAAVEAHLDVLLRHMAGRFPWVRQLAIEALAVLDPPFLESQASALAARIGDIDAGVCCAALQTLSLLRPEALAHHAPAICRLLRDDDCNVQIAALDALLKFDLKALLPHMDAVRICLDDDVADVRRRAGQIVANAEEELANLPQAAVALRFAMGRSYDAWTLSCCSMAGNSIMDLIVGANMTCGELRDALARQLGILKLQVKLVVDGMTVIQHDQDHVMLLDLIDVQTLEEDASLDHRHQAPSTLVAVS